MNKFIYIALFIAMVAMFSAGTTGQKLTDYDLARMDAQCKGECAELKEFSYYKWIGIDNIKRGSYE